METVDIFYMFTYIGNLYGIEWNLSKLYEKVFYSWLIRNNEQAEVAKL